MVWRGLTCWPESHLTWSDVRWSGIEEELLFFMQELGREMFILGEIAREMFLERDIYSHFA